MLEVPKKINLAEYQNVSALDTRFRVVSDNENPIIKTIGRLRIKLYCSNKFIGLA